jgi:hypothetical protein
MSFKQKRNAPKSPPASAVPSGAVAGEAIEERETNRGSPLDRATEGPPDSMPFLAQLETSFGRPLGHLQAYTGRPQILAMQAKAVSRGNQVVFAEENPDLETVAEEVAHSFQPSSGGQDVSDPRDDSEDEAKAAAERVARGEQVDPDGLETPGAEVQRFFFAASMLVGAGLAGVALAHSDPFQSDYDGPFAWDGKATSAPDFPPMSLVEHWSGPAWVVTDEDEATWAEARECANQSTALPAMHQDVPVVCKDTHDAHLEERNGARQALLDEFVCALDSNDTVASARKALDALVKQRKGAGGVPLSAIEGDPALFSHPRMLEIQRMEPKWLVTFAEDFDPIPQLKELLRRAKPGSEVFWAELTAWCQAHPTQAKAATADPEVVELIKASDSTLGTMTDKLQQSDDQVDKNQEEQGDSMDPLSLLFEGGVKLLKTVTSGLDAMSSDESGDQMRMLQLLMGGGVIQNDPKIELERALSAQDPKAFLERWNLVVRDAAQLERFRADPMFAIRVAERLGKGVAERVQLDLKSGVDEGIENGLGEGERKKIREQSTRTAGQLTSLIGMVSHLYGADDTVVMAVVRTWGDTVRAELQDQNGTVDPARKLQAQMILHRAFKDFSGKELCDRLHAHLSLKPYGEALGIVGEQSAVLEAETLAQTSLSVGSIDATQSAAAKLHGLITPVSYFYGADDDKVFDIVATWRNEVAASIAELTKADGTPLGPESTEGKRALLEAQGLLHRRFTELGGKDLSERISAHLSEFNAKRTCALIGSAVDLRAALSIDTQPYSAQITAHEQDEIDSVVRKTAKTLHDEFSETWVDDVDVLALLQALQTELQQRLKPASVDGETLGAYQAKVKAATTQIREAYQAFGNLEEELADHVWDSATRRKCQMIAGTREVPSNPEVVQAILGASVGPETGEDPSKGPDASVLVTAMTTVQRQAYSLAEELDKALDKRDPEGVVARIAKDVAALGNGGPLVLTPLQRTQLLETAFLTIGGDLDMRLQHAFTDPAKADKARESLGMGDLAVSRVPVDPALAEHLDMLQQVDESYAHFLTGDEQADGELLADQEKLREQMARTKVQIVARQRLTALAVRLFDAIETSKVVEQAKGVTLIEAAAKAIGAVPERGHAPLVEKEGDLVADMGDTLLGSVYRGLGISVEQHLGMLPKFVQDRALNKLSMGLTPVSTAALPFALDDKGQAFGIMIQGVAKGLEDQVEPLNSSPEFSAERGVQQAVELHALIAMAHAAVRGEPYQPASVMSGAMNYTANMFLGAFTATAALMDFGARNAAREKAKAKLYNGVADELGMDGEAKVVRLAYEQLFGVSIEYSLRAALGADDPTAEAMTHLADRDERSFVPKILRFAAAKKTDAIYSALFEASEEDKQEVLADAAALNALRALGRKPYDRIVRTLQNKLSLQDMMRSRDGDSDDYDWQITELWGKSKKKLGFGEDVDAMQEDVALFLSVWKNKALKALPDAGKDKELAETQQKEVGEQFKKHCREILDDADLRAMFENSLSERDRNKMLLLIADGGTLTGTHQVMVDVTGSGTDGSILDHIKAMTDPERAAAVKDPSFMLRVMHDLTGEDLKKAVGYLHGTEGTDGLVDSELTLEDTGIFGADVNAAVSGVVGMDKDALLALSKDPVRVAKLIEGMGIQGTEAKANADGTFDNQAQMLLTMMAELRGFEEREAKWESDANERDITAGWGESGLSDEKMKGIADRNGAIAEHRDWLRIKHKFALLNASFGGAEALVGAAQAAFTERGALQDPNDKDATLYVWNQAARDQLWAEVGPEILKTWGNQKVAFGANMLDAVDDLGAPGKVALGVGAALVGFLTGGLAVTAVGTGALLTGGIDGASDMDGKAVGGTWGEVVRDAVVGKVDPSIVQIAKQQQFSRDDEGIVKTIGGVGSKLVIEEWSNIERVGAGGKSLRSVAEAWFAARGAYEEAKAAKRTDETEALHHAMQLARLDYVSFTLSANARVDSFLRDQWKSVPSMTGASDAQMLTYREAVLDRILALSSEEVAVHLGMGSFKEDAISGVQTFERAESLTVGGHTTGLDEGDVGSLLNESRKHRSKGEMMKEQVDHQVDDFSLVDTYSDKKSKIGASYADYKVEFYKAASQSDEEKANGEAGDITDDEAKELAPLLAEVGKSIGDYKAEKTKLANRLKMVVATIMAVVTSLVSGPAGPTFIMSLVLAAAETGASLVIDELVQGNDFDLAREALPALVASVGEKALTHGMENAFGQLKNAWPKQAAYLNNNPFVGFIGNVKEGIEGVPGGELLLEALKKGVVDPALDTVAAPLLHLIDPNELKWGTKSASQEAWQMFQAKLTGLPDTMWIKTMAALKEGGKQALIDALVGKKEETGDLPGVKVEEKKLPKAEDLFTSFRKQAGTQWDEMIEGATWKSGALKKDLIGFLIETGAIVIESDDPGLALEEHLANSKVGKAFANVDKALNLLEDGYQGTDFYGDMFDVLYPHFNTLVTSTVENHQKAKRAVQAHEYLAKNQDKVKDLTLPHGVSEDDAQAFFALYLTTASKGAGVSEADFLDFKNGRWKEISAKLEVTRQIKDGVVARAYRDWLLEDPETFDERVNQRSKFEANFKKGQDHLHQQGLLINQSSMGDDHKAYAKKMLSDDRSAGDLFDFEKGKGKTPNLGEADGMKSFKASYVKMKQDAVIAAVDTYAKAAKYQAMWVAYVRAITDATTWNATYAFGPGESAVSAAKSISMDFFNSLDAKTRDALSEALYGPKPKKYNPVDPRDPDLAGVMQ